MKKSKKISKVKKIVTLGKIKSNSVDENIIPNEYKKLYNSLLYKIRCNVYNKPFSKIKFEISELQYDNEDDFFPYKFYINLNNNDNKMKFEVFLSNIICKYTIRSIDILEDNNGANNGANNNVNNDANIEANNLLESILCEKKIYQQIKGYNKAEGIINEILSQYKIIYVT